MSARVFVYCLLLISGIQSIALGDEVMLAQVSEQVKTVPAGIAVIKQKPAIEEKNKQPFNWSRVGQIPQMIAEGQLQTADIPNPHWQPNACLACHKQAGDRASKKNLRSSKQDAQCQNCHDARFDHSYIHPVKVSVNEEMKQYMRQDFRQLLEASKDRMACNICHDMKLQCLPQNRPQKIINPLFFRGGPFKTRSEQCYFCHDASQYQPLNPHDQIDENGQLNQQKCRVCHAGSITDLMQESPSEEVRFHPDVKLETLCWGCHKWTPHPGGQFTFFADKKGPDHLKQPREDILRRLQQQSEQHDVILPLEPGSGRIYCATCHNPHEKGVINNSKLAKGADSKNRLRAKDICGFCHLQ